MNPPEKTQYALYTCSYRYAGKTWSVDFPATSFEDAEARLSAMHFGKVDGKLVATIPAGPGIGVCVRAVTWLRNILQALMGVAKQRPDQ